MLADTDDCILLGKQIKAIQESIDYGLERGWPAAEWQISSVANKRAKFNQLKCSINTTPSTQTGGTVTNQNTNSNNPVTLDSIPVKTNDLPNSAQQPMPSESNNAITPPKKNYNLIYVIAGSSLLLIGLGIVYYKKK